MSASRLIKQLQKAKGKAQSSSNLREEASLCNQLGEVLAKNGDFQAAIEEHRQELALSEVLHDVIGCAVANRKIGECFAELGNFEAALKHQRLHLHLSRSVRDAAEEQRAQATIGRTFLFRYESDQSQDSLRQAEDAFRKSLAIVDDRLEGVVGSRELSEMRARLYLNLGFVADGLKDSELCTDLIRRSIFIAEKNQLLEDLYRAKFNLGRIHFRNGAQSSAVRCLEQAKESARKMKDKFGESECCHSIGQVQLSLGDFVAARCSLKKAYRLGSQQPADRDTVKRAFKHAIQGCLLEQALSDLGEERPQEAVGVAEQLGDLCCKVGCYSKALEAYRVQLASALALGKPSRELAVIHVSLAATYADLRQPQKAVEHYRQELELRQNNPKEECDSWLNIAAAEDEAGRSLEELDTCYSTALQCAKRAALPKLQRQVLRAWLAARQRRGSAHCDDTAAQLQELCAAGGGGEGEEEEEEEEEEENSEVQEDSDIQLSDSDEDLEEYDRMVPGKRTAGRWNRRNEKGETSLHRACIEGNLRQVQYLVEQGHPVNPRDYCGWTPLHEACNHGHCDVVSVLLDHGAHVNDPGGPLCEGVTPLHDALSCGHFPVARLLVERGASVTVRNSKGDTPQDSLRLWLKTYSRHLDQDARQECSETERLMKRAAAGRGPVAVLERVGRGLQDSQLYDAENSEPLVPPPRPHSPRRQEGRAVPQSPTRRQEGRAVPQSPTRRQEGRAVPQSPTRRSSGGRPPGAREAILFREESSSSDSDCSISPLRPVRPRLRFPEPSPPPTRSGVAGLSQGVPTTTGTDSVAPAVSRTEEYHRAMRCLGSAKSRLLHAQDQSEPECGPASANGRSALVPEEEDVADDWLEDDLGELQPRKRRRVGAEPRPVTSSSGRSQSHHPASPEPRVPPPSSRGLSLHRGARGSQRPRQVKMTQLSGMVMLGRREVVRSISPTMEEPHLTHPTQPPPLPQAVAVPLPPPIRITVRVQDRAFLIPVPHSEADSCTVSWLCDQAAQRYYQASGLLPRLSLQKEGALLSPQDLLLTVLHTNEEVLAEVCSWDLPPLPERYKKACQSLATGEHRLVLRLCEVQDGSPSVCVSGLSLPPAVLTPVLRALKLQASLTQLRLSGNRLSDDLMPELVSAATTMPRLRLLDLSANRITGEGLKKAALALEGRRQPAFPCLEELVLSVNPLGDSVAEALSGVLSACPLLSTLSLQACGLTARFLQQHRLLLETALSGTGHLRSVCLSHNALGSTGFELVLKTLPLRSLTHLYLSAVRSVPADPPLTGRLAALLAQEECALTHLSLAGNGLTDCDLSTLTRCLAACPSLVSLDVSGNPAVTSAGLEALLTGLRDGRRTLELLNVQGCQVCGPWDGRALDSLTYCVRDLQLCSQRLNKLDRKALQESLAVRGGAVLSRSAKCLLRAAPSL
ncbi:tonsoku-like protein [Conger conger]|uniref:tonsoku-like protein n=1 Tax=Conger conger TaxID=82655 RepID=UPI002A5AE948|nr:tonsoku-like protein [Conger conger]